MISTIHLSYRITLQRRFSFTTVVHRNECSWLRCEKDRAIIVIFILNDVHTYLYQSVNESTKLFIFHSRLSVLWLFVAHSARIIFFFYFY